MNTNKPTLEKHEKLIFCFSVAVSALSLIIVFSFIVAQTYVRWKINQTFTFLGENELEALTVSSFALLIGLLHAYRPQK